MNYMSVIAIFLVVSISLTSYAEKILIVQGKKNDGKMDIYATVIPKPNDFTERYTVGNKFKVITYSRFGFKQAERTFDWRHYPASQECRKGTNICINNPAYSVFSIYFQDFKSAVKIKIFEDGKLIKEMPIDFDPAYLKMEETP